MKIGVGLCIYQDFDSLRRLMISLQCCAFDYLIAVDGKYKEYPKDLPLLSDKATIDLIHGFSKQIPVKYIEAPGKTQIEKRNIYFDECGKLGMDACFVLDSDDYIICKRTQWDLFKRDLEDKIQANKTYRQGYCVPCIDRDRFPDNPQIQNIARIFYKPETLRYADTHFTIRNKKTGVIMVYTGNPVCNHIMMAHDHLLRMEQYDSIGNHYQDMLQIWEKEGRYRNVI